MHTYKKNIAVKFHCHPIWNNRAFFEDSRPNKNKKKKMRVVSKSVPELKIEIDSFIDWLLQPFVCTIVCTVCFCSPEIPNIPHKAEVQSAFPRDKLEYLNWASSSDTFPNFAKLLSLPTYMYHILLGLTVSTGGLTESLVRFLFGLLVYPLMDVAYIEYTAFYLYWFHHARVVIIVV